MNIIIASDHAGFSLKQVIIQHLQTQNLTVTDLGTHNQDSCDYPNLAHAVCQKVLSSATSPAVANPTAANPADANPTAANPANANSADPAYPSSLGILICGTGIGMSMTANRYPGIRAALCTSEFQAKATREHNNANVLCLGERVTGPGLALEMVDIFLRTPFAGGRHQRRLDLMEQR